MSEDELNEYKNMIDHTSGAQRTWAYITWTNLRDGYYSPNELIDLAVQQGFRLDNPFTKIRKGTQIQPNAEIKNGSIIQGTGVVIGEGTVLDQARVAGSNIIFGKNNRVTGGVLADNLRIGDLNDFQGILGDNADGLITIGNHNIIRNVVFKNVQDCQIKIGDFNELLPNLNISNPFPGGRIKIGNHNHLGDGGGGVISGSYRFAEKWAGPLVIGSYVEMTRGAEVGGFSVIGWPLESLTALVGGEQALQNIFVQANVREVKQLVDNLWDLEPEPTQEKRLVGLYGVVKVKRSCLMSRTRVRDNVNLRCSYLRNIEVRERCKIYFSVVALPKPGEIDVTDRAIEQKQIGSDQNWADFPTTIQKDIYPPGDYNYFSGDVS